MKLTAGLVAIALCFACLDCQVGALSLPSETLYEVRALDASSSSSLSHKTCQDKCQKVSPVLQERLRNTYQEATPIEQKEIQHIMQHFCHAHTSQGGGHASLEKRADDGCKYRSQVRVSMTH